MILAVMQPYFFPYLGYFDLIKYVDRWLVYDTAQYVRRSWINRNRVLHPSEGWQYIGVPVVSHPQKTEIRHINIHPELNWRKKILGQLEHYRGKAPFYREVEELMVCCLDADTESLSLLDVSCLSNVCQFIGLEFEPLFISEMELKREEAESAEDFILRLCRSVGASEYANLPGGVELYDAHVFESAGLKLTFRQPRDWVYDTGECQFEPRLSVVDALMWNRREKVLDFLV